MATPDDVTRLAALARISVPEHELAKFAGEFESILAYIGQIDALTIPEGAQAVPAHRNVFREDGEPHPSGQYTDALAEQFPRREGDYLAVRQIISHD